MQAAFAHCGGWQAEQRRSRQSRCSLPLTQKQTQKATQQPLAQQQQVRPPAKRMRLPAQPQQQPEPQQPNLDDLLADQDEREIKHRGNQSKVQPKEKGPTIKELKAALMKLGLKKSGRKAELVERLREYRASREPSKKRSALASPTSPPHAASVKVLRQFSPAAQPVLEQRNKRKGISPLVIEVGEARPPTLDIGSPVVHLQPETQALQRTFDLTDTSNDTFEPTSIPTYYSLFHETDGMLHVDHQTAVLIIDTQAMHQLHLKGGLIAQTEGHFFQDRLLVCGS